MNPWRGSVSAGGLNAKVQDGIWAGNRDVAAAKSMSCGYARHWKRHRIYLGKHNSGLNATVHRLPGGGVLRLGYGDDLLKRAIIGTVALQGGRIP